MSEQPQHEPKWMIWIEWGLLLGVAVVAAYLRYWRIEEVPPGFNSDEAVGAMGALTTLRDGLRYSYDGQGGGGTLGFYFAAVSFWIFGPSIAAIRGVAAWAGVMSIIFNYWTVREVFRIEGLNRARWVAGFSTLALTVSVWHIWPSRVAFATIGVPFLMLPSIYFLWRGLNFPRQRWTFFVSGLFLGSSLYIYLSGVFVPPLYAAFFIAQWAIVKFAGRMNWKASPPTAYMTTQFWNLFATALTSIIILLPMVFILLTIPELDQGSSRVSQAIFTNPQINQGDPWGLLWRSTVGNLGAYGISLSWFIGQAPRLVYIPASMGLLIFLGFLISLLQAARGRAAYLFILLWYPIMLLPSILSPDSIPHNLRTIGATTATYAYVAITIMVFGELLLLTGRRWLLPRLGTVNFRRLSYVATLLAVLIFGWYIVWANLPFLRSYFYVFPTTNDAQAAFHVYAIETAEEINKESDPEVAFILPRNTAAGDINRNFTTDFVIELGDSPSSHFWVVDDERTLADDLTQAAADHTVIRIIEWKTSKHTGADPKGAMDYYLEKYGYYNHRHGFDSFDIHTYQLETKAPNIAANEILQPINDISFGNQLKLTGVAFGDAGDVSAVNQPQAHSNDLLWLRLAWEKMSEHPENLKTSILLYSTDGQLITQIDKLLLNNINQLGSREWPVGEQSDSYFLIPIPPATPPGNYVLQVAVYGEESLTRLVPSTDAGSRTAALGNVKIVPAQKRAKPEQVSLALPIGREILPNLTLVGFETLPGETVRTGANLGASILWQAGEQPTDQDIAMQLVAKTGEGRTEFNISEPVGLAGNEYPTSAWQPGELLRGWLLARVPPSLEPGLYELEIRLVSATEPTNELGRLPIGEFTISGWSRNFTPPQPQLPVNANYNSQATLLGIDANAVSVIPGAPLEITTYWRADAEFNQDMTSFVQVIGPDGNLYGQLDHTPGNGEFPTSGWLPGEYITDINTITISPDAPSGDYQIAIGFYSPDTGKRLPVTGQNCQPDACVLSGLTVN
jgi:hypothetical protein